MKKVAKETRPVLHTGPRLLLLSIMMVFVVLTTAMCSSAPPAPAATAPAEQAPVSTAPAEQTPASTTPAEQAPATEASPATQAPSPSAGDPATAEAVEIVPGFILERGDRQSSPSGAYYLSFQQDGNIVVYRTTDERYVWGLNALPLVPFDRAVRAEVMPDGRFVVTDDAGTELWSVPEANPQPGSKLTLDDTGTLQIVAPGDVVVWSSAETILGDKPLPLGASAPIEREYRYVSPDGNYYLIFQNDGNLVVRRMSDGGYVWGLDQIPGISIPSVEFAGMTPDGGLAVWAADGTVIWIVPESLQGTISVIQPTATPGGVVELVPFPVHLTITSEGHLELNNPILINADGSPVIYWSSSGGGPAVAASEAAPTVAVAQDATTTTPDAAASAATPTVAIAQDATSTPSVAASEATPTGPAGPVVGSLGLTPGQELTVGEKYLSPDGRFALLFPQDGNLMVRSVNPDEYMGGLFNVQGENGVWKNAKQAKIAEDGNLILLDAQGTEIWSTNVPNPEPGMQLSFSDTGRLQLGLPSGYVAWTMIGENTSPSARETSVLPNGAPQMTAEEISILEKHNELRALHQDTPPLQWSAVLAAEAQQWANTCGPMQHSRATNGAGENLAAFRTETMVERVQSWYDEVNVYNYNNPGFNKGGSSQQTQTGHFTQFVWKSTTHLGCAKALCPSSPFPGWLVCRYWPAGNYQDNGPNGEAAAFTRNVLPLK